MSKDDKSVPKALKDGDLEAVTGGNSTMFHADGKPLRAKTTTPSATAVDPETSTIKTGS